MEDYDEEFGLHGKAFRYEFSLDFPDDIMIRGH